MRVIAYYEPVASHDADYEQRLLARWMANWKGMGYAPTVVGLRHAQANPAYRWFSAWARAVPSYNPRPYEDACWIRWLALAKATVPGESFVFADYDMANLAYPPSRAVAQRNVAVPVNLDGAHLCGPFLLTHEIAWGLPYVMRMVMEMERTLHPDQGHFGDMMYWRAAQRYHPDMVAFRYECEYWTHAGRPAICHMANPAVGPFNLTKHQAWDILEGK